MRALRGAVVGAVLICAMAPRVEAQIHKGATNIALFAGVYTFNEFQGDTDPMFGIRGGSFVSQHLGLEASFEIIPTGEGVTVLGYQGNVVVHLAPRHRTVPFLTAGVGGITFTGGGESETRFAGNVGAGVKHFVSEKAALRFEVKDRIYSVFGDTINDVHFTAGVEFTF